MLQCFCVEDAHINKSSLVFNFLDNNSWESAWIVLQSCSHPALKFQQQCHAGFSWSLFCASLLLDMRMCPHKEDIKWTSPCRVTLSVSQGNAKDLCFELLPRTQLQCYWSKAKRLHPDEIRLADQLSWSWVQLICSGAQFLCHRDIFSGLFEIGEKLKVSKKDNTNLFCSIYLCVSEMFM